MSADNTAEVHPPKLVPEGREIPPKSGVTFFDPATIFNGLMQPEVLNGDLRKLHGPSPELQRWIEVYDHYLGPDDWKIKDLEAMVGGESKRSQMNGLLTQHGFPAAFLAAFDSSETGMVSVLDKKMAWYHGEKTTFSRDSQEYQAIKFDPSMTGMVLKAGEDPAINLWNIIRHDRPIGQIRSRPDEKKPIGDTMWVTEVPQNTPYDSTTLFEFAAKAVTGEKDRYQTPWSSVIMPEIAFETKESRPELEGALLPNLGFLKSAHQAARINIDENGATVTIGSDMYARLGSSEPDPVVFGKNGNVLFWFTEHGSNMPIGISVVSPEAWLHKEQRPPEVYAALL